MDAWCPPPVSRGIKESFGYVLFSRHTREPHFVKTDKTLEKLSREKVCEFLRLYYSSSANALEYDFVFSENQDLELSAPIAMYLEISNQCNLNCGHCYKPLEVPKELPSLGRFLDLVDELADSGVLEIRICGNEPGISKYLVDVSKKVKQRDMFLGINTNAFYGSKRQSEVVDLDADFIAFSVDGNQATHDAIRIAGSYEKVISMLEKTSRTKTKCRINTVVSRSTIGQMENAVWLGEKFNAEVSFLPFRPVGKNTEFCEVEKIDNGIMLSSVREVMRLRDKYPSVLIFTYFDILGEKAIYHHSLSFSSPCPARKNGFIEYNGNFYPCDFLRYLGETYLCGDVFKESFRQIWRNSKSLKKFQGLKHGKCLQCAFYMKKCYGECISGSLIATGKPEDELCFADLL